MTGSFSKCATALDGGRFAIAGEGGLGALAQQTDVDGHRNELAAPSLIATRIGFVGRQDAAGLARCEGGVDRVPDALLYLGMSRVACMAESDGQVGGADEHRVHALDGSDRFDVFHARARFHLDDQAQFFMGGGEVVRHTVPTSGAGQAAAHTTNTMGRITHGTHQGLSLLGGFDHGNHQGLGTDIQQLLDQVGVASHRPHHRRGGIGRHGLELAEYAGYGVGCVFAIDQHPVVTGAGDDLGGIAGGETGPDTVLGLC